MKTRYRLIRRGLRGGAFYCVDTATGKRASLEQLKNDRENIVAQLVDSSPRIGELETKLLQIEAPAETVRKLTVRKPVAGRKMTDIGIEGCIQERREPLEEGSVKGNVEPAPVSLSTQTLPPWLWMTCFSVGELPDYWLRSWE